MLQPPIIKYNQNECIFDNMKHQPISPAGIVTAFRSLQPFVNAPMRFPVDLLHGPVIQVGAKQ